MAKLTKEQAKLHAEAAGLLEHPMLSRDEREFVLENWREDAQHVNSSAGAFFTPLELASDLSIEVTGRHLLDLCAGIGSLAYACYRHNPGLDITCVEINPDYVAVGRKVLPEARWIRADAFDYHPAARLLDKDDALPFDCVVSNPPYGRVKTHANKFGRFEYDLIAHAKALAADGVFLIPQASVPFRFSGHQTYQQYGNSDYEKFHRKTGIVLSMNCGIDTETYRTEWTIKPPVVEIALGFKEDQ